MKGNERELSIWKSWDERELVFGRIGMKGNWYLEELGWNDEIHESPNTG